uniref:Fungal lipase-type domain-containing protein n=1 Tax=Arcella intermedia TaxID=1963864 RepID=A0A6B2LE34_9EUKA
MGVLLLSPFNLSFDLQEAREDVLIAFASYCGADSLKSWDCFWCNTTAVGVTAILYNSTYDIAGFVGIHYARSEIVVVFRGTVKTSFSNWIEDLNFVQTNPYPDLSDISVHEGFWLSYLSIESQLQRALKDTLSLCGGCKRTVYIGHSLGGALAALALMDTNYKHQLQQPLPVLYTFGQPRTGNLMWAQFMSTWTNTSTRVVHNRDIVPHLPPMAFGYHHVPVEVWMEDSSSYVVCNSSGEDPSCSDSVEIISIKDHLVYLGYDHTLGSTKGC